MIPFCGVTQDKIYFLNGTMIEATAVKVDSSMITYKKFNNPEGPAYFVLQKEIAVIEFSDGSFRTFKRKGFLGFSFDSVYAKRNIISFRVSGILFNGLGMNYERIFGNGRWGFRIPLVMDFHDNDFIGGMGFAYYPEGQVKNSVFLAGDVFSNAIGKKSGISLNTGFKANWNQKFAITCEVGAAFIIKKWKVSEFVYPGVLTPGLLFSYRF